MDDLKLRSKLIRMAAAKPELRRDILAAITAAAMPESEFWKIVADLGWGTRSTDYNAIKKKLLRNLSPNQAAAFRTTYEMLRGRLYKAITKWEEEGDEFFSTGQARNPRSIGLGDDSFGDLLAHIIGLGKREFEAVLRKPQLAKDRAMRGDYKESFAYVIPYTSDYAMLDVSHYQQRGEKIAELVEWLSLRPEPPRSIRWAFETLSNGFAALQSYHPHKFSESGDELIMAAKAVQDWWDDLRKAWGRDDEKAIAREALVAAMPDHLMDIGHLYWAVRNLVTDMRDFLLD